MARRCFAVIAGGGTAGHVVPALAIGKALVARGHQPQEIRFVGARRGIDRRLVGPTDFPLTLLPGRGIARRLTLDNAWALAGSSVALSMAVVLIGRWRPAVVVSMGGFAAAPCALAAALWRVPLVLAEQNGVPTATHRLVARFAVAAAVPNASTPLPHAVVTGNPVRDEVLAVDRTDLGRRTARAELGLPQEGIVIGAMGGSLGAGRINTAISELVARWRAEGRTGVAVRHVIGDRDWDDAALRGNRLRKPQPISSEGLVYQQVRYEEDMPSLLAAADLLVCRAGGSTVAELAVVGRAAILIPLPIAPFDHQAHNARPLVDAGAALMLRDSDVNADRLDAEIEPLLADGNRLRAMGDAALTVGRRDAAERVAELIEHHARRRTDIA